MRLAVQRAVGAAGATAVAIGAALVLALPASAHTPNWTPECVGGQMKVSVDLESYAKGSHGKTNTVTLTDTPAGGTAITLVKTTDFDSSFKASFDATSTPATGSASVANTFEIVVSAWDDPDKSKGYSIDWTKTIDACVTTPPSSSSSSVPTKPSGPSSQPSVPSSSPSSSQPVAVAATSTTPVGAAALPFTGANVGLPLGIAGALVVVGGGLLFWLRFSARRRHSS